MNVSNTKGKGKESMNYPTNMEKLKFISCAVLPCPKNKVQIVIT